MSPGRKANTKKSAVTGSGRPSANSVAGKKPAPGQAASAQTWTGFGPGNYYRQGVLVPGGPHKGAMPRNKTRPPS
jgi:hypothetical protein